MKKALVLTLALMGCLSLGLVASAHSEAYRRQPPPPRNHGEPHSSDRMKAQQVLNATRDEIFSAERVVRRFQQDDLQRAFSLQKKARRYYNQGLYRTTIRYSLQARDIASEIIEKARRHSGPPPRRRHRF